MNDEQQLKETLIEFLGDVFGVQGQTDQEKLTGIQQTLSKIDQQTQQKILQATQEFIQKSGITKETKDRNREEWDRYVGQFQTQLGMNKTPMAKLGGILNYINKLNTIR